MPDKRLDSRLKARQGIGRTIMQRRRRKAGVEIAQPRCGGERGAGHLKRRAQGQQIGAQRVGIGLMRGRMGHRPRQPEIERAIGLARGEKREALGQAQHLAVETGAGGLLGLRPQPAQKAQAVARHLGRDGPDLDRMRAA